MTTLQEAEHNVQLVPPSHDRQIRRNPPTLKTIDKRLDVLLRTL